MQNFEENLASRVNGVLQPMLGVTVTVKTAQGLLATIYSDDGATVQPNPMITDANGRFGFYAANGPYKLTFAGQQIEGITRDIELYDADDEPPLTLAQAALPSAASRIGFQGIGTGARGRTIENKLLDLVSVADFTGIDPTGVASSLVAFTSAYTNAAPGARIIIPPGDYAGVSGTLTGTKFVIWEAAGQPSGGGLWNLPGLVKHGFATREICSIGQTVPDGDLKNSFNRDASHTGGTPGFVCTNISVQTKAGAANTNFEWGFLSVLDNYAAAGENVAIYGQGNKRGNGPTWASVFEVIDHTTANNPAQGLVGIEVDVRANGNDDNKNRVGIDIVADRRIKTAGAYSHTSYGVRVQNNDDVNSLVKVAYGVVANNVQVGFDTSEATIQTAAFKMADGQAIAFDTAAQQQLKYDGTGINYTVAGASKVRLNANGSIELGGAMKISPTFSTGTQVPTIGTNKPGTTGGAPGTWVNVVINGSQYWLPLWAN